MPTSEERFWSKVDKTTSCWEWIGCKVRGYGQFGFEGKVQYAHRVSWKLLNGDPLDLKVLHKCDNPSCVNPNHLFLGTQKENIDDMLSKNRQVKGEQKPDVKLTKKQVLEIRHSKLSQRKLSKLYNVCPSHVWHIKNHKKWKHV